MQNAGPPTMSKLDFDFSEIVKNAKDIIIVTKSFPIDPPGPEIVYVNQAFTRLTGYSSEEVIGKNPRILQPDNNQEDIEARKKIRDALTNQCPVKATVKNYAKNGREYWLEMNIFPLKDSSGKVTHFAAIERDVTAQKILEEQLEILAKTDPLTNLLNRRAFDEGLTNEFSRYKRSGEPYSILMLDVDFFKAINDKHGHATGDHVLKNIADACSSVIRIHDSASRYGGDEFSILLPYTKLKSAYTVAQKIRKLISQITTPQMNEKLSVSIGVAEVESSDLSHSAIFERADDSLYHVKNSGRDGNSASTAQNKLS